MSEWVAAGCIGACAGIGAKQVSDRACEWLKKKLYPEGIDLSVIRRVANVAMMVFLGALFSLAFGGATLVLGFKALNITFNPEALLLIGKVFAIYGALIGATKDPSIQGIYKAIFA